MHDIRCPPAVLPALAWCHTSRRVYLRTEREPGLYYDHTQL